MNGMPPRKQIAICEYDPRWPELFAGEQAALRLILGERVVDIEHVGSTAVPGLRARCAIDIMVGVSRFLRDLDLCVSRLTKAGWEHRPDIEQKLPLGTQRRYLHKPGGPEYLGRRAFQLHIVEYGGGTTCARMRRKRSNISNSRRL
jgi:GrpB-like predicted nucleotidyltransferase (UPF0157 family)